MYIIFYRPSKKFGQEKIIIKKKFNISYIFRAKYSKWKYNIKRNYSYSSYMFNKILDWIYKRTVFKLLIIESLSIKLLIEIIYFNKKMLSGARFNRYTLHIAINCCRKQTENCMTFRILLYYFSNHKNCICYFPIYKTFPIYTFNQFFFLWMTIFIFLINIIICRKYVELANLINTDFKFILHKVCRVT